MGTRAFPPRTLRSLIYWAFIPVLVCELALSPFWFARVYAYHSWLPSVQLLITAILLPVYLAILGSVFVWRSGHRATVAGFVILIASVALTVFLDYAVWGFSTRRFWTPDYETVLIVRTAAEIAFAITLFPPFVALTLRSFGRYAHRNA
jgi:ABC-type uncharacterized transport system permease subunit